MSPGLVILIGTPLVMLVGFSFFLFEYPRLKRRLQEEIDRDVRNNLDEINNIKFNIRMSIMRIVYVTALLILFTVLCIIHGAF